jgi:hypothetical protein
LNAVAPKSARSISTRDLTSFLLGLRCGAAVYRVMHQVHHESADVVQLHQVAAPSGPNGLLPRGAPPITPKGCTRCTRTRKLEALIVHRDELVERFASGLLFEQYDVLDHSF